MADIKTAGSRFHNPHTRRRIHKRDLDLTINFWRRSFVNHEGIRACGIGGVV
ncbi:Uncharacterised protein [Shigella flexneri]|nr:Uncharacterised protein [Shigella flexneri]